jgi:hypothetical protein
MRLWCQGLASSPCGTLGCWFSGWMTHYSEVRLFSASSSRETPVADRVCGQYAAGAEVQEEEPTARACVVRPCVYRCGSYACETSLRKSR